MIFVDPSGLCTQGSGGPPTSFLGLAAMAYNAYDIGSALLSSMSEEYRASLGTNGLQYHASLDGNGLQLKAELAHGGYRAGAGLQVNGSGASVSGGYASPTGWTTSELSFALYEQVGTWRTTSQEFYGYVEPDQPLWGTIEEGTVTIDFGAAPRPLPVTKPTTTLGQIGSFFQDRWKDVRTVGSALSGGINGAVDSAVGWAEEAAVQSGSPFLAGLAAYQGSLIRSGAGMVAGMVDWPGTIEAGVRDVGTSIEYARRFGPAVGFARQTGVLQICEACMGVDIWTGEPVDWSAKVAEGSGRIGATAGIAAGGLNFMARLRQIWRLQHPTGANSAMQGRNLARQLTSEEQMGQALAGRGEPVFGAGTNRRLLDAERLSQQYGGSPAEWAKMRGASSDVHGIQTPAGNNFEIHWYQNVKTGKVVELKTKVTGH